MFNHHLLIRVNQCHYLQNHSQIRKFQNYLIWLILWVNFIFGCVFLIVGLLKSYSLYCAISHQLASLFLFQSDLVYYYLFICFCLAFLKYRKCFLLTHLPIHSYFLFIRFHHLCPCNLKSMMLLLISKETLLNLAGNAF